MEQSSRPMSQELAIWEGSLLAFEFVLSKEHHLTNFARRKVLKQLTKDLIKRDKEEINVCNVAQN